jgi:hypothetical protein
MPIRLAKGTPIKLTVTPPARVADSRVLDVPTAKQTQGNWCWAACCWMVLAYYDKAPGPVCKIVSDLCSSDCCASPQNASCDQTRWPQDVYQHFNLKCTLSGHAFTPDEIRAEIDQNRPVEVYIETYDKKAGHVAIISGYYPNDVFAVNDPAVNDPQNGSGKHTYLDIQNWYGYGTWTKTYSNLTP